MGPAPEGSPLTRMPDAWRKLAAVAGHTADDLFDPVAFVENLDTDTQVISMAVRGSSHARLSLLTLMTTLSESTEYAKSSRMSETWLQTFVRPQVYGCQGSRVAGL